MRAQDRARLTAALRDHVAKIAADLRAKMREPGAARARAEQLHKDERVGEDFEVWTDLLSRRAAVLWVLESVYVRVLEDRGLLQPGRLLDPEAQQLFEKLASNLGDDPARGKVRLGVADGWAASGVETLYGWAGWTALQRLKAIPAIDEELEDVSVPLADRIGLLDGAWRLLSDVAREDAAAATRLKAELQALMGPEGPSRELTLDWKKRFPPPIARVASTQASAPKAKRDSKTAMALEDEVSEGEAEETKDA